MFFLKLKLYSIVVNHFKMALFCFNKRRNQDFPDFLQNCNIHHSLFNLLLCKLVPVKAIVIYTTLLMLYKFILLYTLFMLKSMFMLYTLFMLYTFFML